jgi:hypothetical protein
VKPETNPSGVVLRVEGSKVMVMGRRQCLIESRSNPGQFHTVCLSEANAPACTCTGFTIRKRCWHADTIRSWMLGKVSATIDHEADE